MKFDHEGYEAGQQFLRTTYILLVQLMKLRNIGLHLKKYEVIRTNDCF